MVFIFENENYCKDITTLYRILCSMEYIILLKEKYSEEKYTYMNLDVKQKNNCRSTLEKHGSRIKLMDRSTLARSTFWRIYFRRRCGSPLRD